MKHRLLRPFRWYFGKTALPFWLVLIVDCLIVVLAGLMADLLHNQGGRELSSFVTLVVSLSCYLVAYLVGFIIMRTYRSVIRYSSFVDLFRVSLANLIGASLVFVVRHITSIDQFLQPLTWQQLFTSFVLATVAMWGIRIVIKYLYDIYYVSAKAQKVFIYGAKEGGVALAKGIASQDSKYVVAGFVSDQPNDWQHMLMGVKIYPNDDRLLAKMRQKGATVLMVSPLQSDNIRSKQELVDQLVEAGIRIMVYSRTEWDGKSDLSHAQLKEVDIEDLLPRNQIEVDLETIGRVLSNRCILITGAAGSIGSEIVRQVAAFRPSKMVLIDHAETPLHDIRLMMAREFPQVTAITMTTSITHDRHMEVLFDEHRPNYVFHAAAYKHVPMMEDNPGAAVINNILGTRVIADLSVKYGVEKFVMVSTDKAVNPTNVMGCSKRICEMYCQSLDKAIKEGRVAGSTQFVTTRFGNVLGSNGSVIPLFKEQIKAGGPLTVTHPEIIRYFMLIPEACRLVLQAGTMGHGSEVFVFDMGKPVKIADLARRMLYLSGATHIKIEYTGLRDGEKLYEELLNKEENTMPSSHPKIKLATVRELDYAEVNAAIDQLIRTTRLDYSDMDIVRKMKALVPEFKSKNSKYEELEK